MIEPKKIAQQIKSVIDAYQELSREIEQFKESFRRLPSIRIRHRPLRRANRIRKKQRLTRLQRRHKRQ